MAGIAVLGVGAATVLPTGGALADGWGGYANGAIPLSALSKVGGVYLRSDAAAAMVALRDAYISSLGISLEIEEGYRDYATQVALYSAYLNGAGNLAAYPGTSNHGWGLAVDFKYPMDRQGNRAFDWMLKNSTGYGWWCAGQRFSQIEAWHWEYNGVFTPRGFDIAEEKDMFYVHARSNPTVHYCVYHDGNGRLRMRVAGFNEWAFRAAAGGVSTPGDDDVLIGLAAECGYQYMVPNPPIAPTIDQVKAGLQEVLSTQPR